MSQSLVAKRISDTMALASDSLFDKFGLLDPVNTNDNMDFELPFEDLDFGDLLDVKQEPLYEQAPQPMASPVASSITDEAVKIEEADNSDLFEAININSADNDPFFNMESLMDDASLDSIKSDCMWSSVNLFANQENSRKRRRDVSLTLSECAEGFLSINSFDVNMLDSLNTQNNMMNIEDTASDTSSCDQDSFMANSEDEEADEEIDVVGTDLGGSSARTRHCFRPNKDLKKHRSHHRIEAGRSLLKKQQPKVPEQQKPVNSSASKTFLDDHCYFLARPEKDIKPLKGMLTPNESSEEDEEVIENGELSTGQTTCSNMVDKRKIAEAVQSLIKNRPESVNSSNNVKFRFRMKFKSTLAATNMKKAVKCEAEEFRRERRKSASKNAFCPPPPGMNNNSTSVEDSSSSKSKLSSNQTSTLAHHASKTKKRSLLAKMHQKGESEKCREIRDLHNSMERQRRVEQRNHLAYLKKQIPEVADLDKASKLTILRKATDYCHLLSNMDNRIRKEKDKENGKHQMLKKKLADLKAKQDARRSTGRYRY